MPKSLEGLRRAAEAKRKTDRAYTKEIHAAIDSQEHTVIEIAQAAGITRSAVYQHLNRKEQQK